MQHKKPRIAALSTTLAIIGMANTSLLAQSNLAAVRIKNGEAIAFLGDSITQAGARNATGYCKLVMRGLALHGVKARMIPAGVSGHKSNQMLKRLDKDVIAKKPQWMTLSCGVNDVWHRKRGVKLPEYRRNIKAIVERAQAAGIKVMILTSTMIKEDPKNELNRQLAAYNAYLRDLAKAKGCVLVDLNAAMQAALIKGPKRPRGNQLTTDGVHMNALGNIMMALGVLEGFGLGAQHLEACRANFEAIPRSCRLRLTRTLSAAQFRKLQRLAGARGISVDALLAPAIDAKLAELLGSR